MKKSISPQRPSNLSPYALACLTALAQAKLASYISLGGALGLFHYLPYRLTNDVDTWWAEAVTQEQRHAVVQALQAALSAFGDTRMRSWGDVDSIELNQQGKTVFSFQIARRSAHLEEPVSAGWIDVPLDSIADLVASKMVALVERGAPRDFLDIYTLCQAGLLSIEECWNLWRQRQSLVGSDLEFGRAALAIETHLERIALHRPLEKIEDISQREQAHEVRAWFRDEFLRGVNE